MLTIYNLSVFFIRIQKIILLENTKKNPKVRLNKTITNLIDIPIH